MEAWLTPAVLWMIIGLLLMVLELALSVFVLLFIGAGAILTGVLLWMGVDISQPWQWALTGISSLFFIVVFRPMMKRSMDNSTKGFEEHHGQIVPVMERITPNTPGIVLYKGARWRAVSEENETLEVGSKAVILQCKGLELHVKAA